MSKVTLREDDSVLELVSELSGEEGPFEGKSDFYRFARDYTLNQLVEGYEPRYKGFEEKIEELEGSDVAARAVAEVQDDFDRAYDLAVSIHGTATGDKPPEEKVEEIDDMVSEFLTEWYEISVYTQYHVE